MNLTKIEVLLDKIALLQETLKTQGDIDLMDLQLLKRYAGQLAALVDEQLGAVSSPVQSQPPAPVSIAPDESVGQPDWQPDVDETPAFALSLDDSDEQEDEVVAYSPEVIEVDDTPAISFFDEADDATPDSADALPEVTPEPVVEPEATSVPKETASPSLFVDEDDDSLNDRFKVDESDLLNKLKKQPIRSLKQEIDLNQKFWFTNELLDGNGLRFNQLLEQLDKATSLQEASALLHKELESALYDEEKSRVFHKLLELVDRRFMAG